MISSKRFRCANSPPHGSVDRLAPGAVFGWARDPDISSVTDIHVWAEGIYLGAGKAWEYRGDLPFPDKVHGFSIPVNRGGMCKGRNVRIDVYTFDKLTGIPKLIDGVKYINCR